MMRWPQHCLPTQTQRSCPALLPPRDHVSYEGTVEECTIQIHVNTQHTVRECGEWRHRRNSAAHPTSDSCSSSSGGAAPTREVIDVTPFFNAPHFFTPVETWGVFDSGAWVDFRLALGFFNRKTVFPWDVVCRRSRTEAFFFDGALALDACVVGSHGE